MSTTQLQTSTISLSVTSIKESIYALSALHAYLSESENIPPILTRSNGDALATLIRQGSVYVAMELPEIGLDVVSTEDDIVTLSVTVASNAVSAVRRAIEEAVKMRALHCCFIKHDGKLAERYASDLKNMVEMIRNKAGANTDVPSLRPYRY